MKKKREKNLRPAEIEERIEDYWKTLQGDNGKRERLPARKLLYVKKSGEKI